MNISVIIPAVNEADNISAAINSVLRQPGPFEIIVVDGGSSDETVSISRPHARVIESERRGRAAQMNSGARLAKGEVLLFLHADSSLPPGGLDHLRRLLADPAVVGGTFMLRFNCDRTLLKLYAFFTRFRFLYFHYGDQGIFVRRPVFERMNGFKEWPLMEDIEFLQRLDRLGRRGLVKLPVTTSARRYLERGILRQQFLNNWLVLLYLLGVKPDVLAGWYR